MYKGLSPGAIGISAPTLQDGFAAAKIGGFQGLDVNIEEIATLIAAKGVDAVKALFTGSGIRPAAWGVPVDWRGDEATWRAGLAKLAPLARAAQQIGCNRTATFILSFSNERDFDENYKFHVERFKPIAEIIGEYGTSIGLEFLGPKTLWTSGKYPFIHTMDAMLAMCREIGPNVGLLVDCWHWYTSHATVDDIRNLRPEQVVYVHVNDAPAGVAIDEQQDAVRDLPGATGIIDIVGFLQALEAIGYQGPVVPEPFKKDLADLPSDAERLKLVGASMDTIFDLAGVKPV